MDNEVQAIMDMMVYAQSDLMVGEQIIKASAGREYTDLQLIVARRAIGDAMLKLQMALSKINEKTVQQHDIASDSNSDGDYHNPDTLDDAYKQLGSRTEWIRSEIGGNEVYSAVGDI